MLGAIGAGSRILSSAGWIDGDWAFIAADTADPHRDAVIALRRSGDPDWRYLTALDLKPEPDDFRSFVEYEAFMEGQQAIFEILASGTVELLHADGRSSPVRWSYGNVFTRLPAVYWYQAFIATLAVLFGVGVWAFRPESLAARFYALTGVAIAFIILPAAIYGNRQLALDAATFSQLSFWQQFGTWLFAGSGICLLTAYPRPIGGKRLRLFIGVCTAVPLWLFASQEVDDLHLIINLPIGLAFVAFSLLATVQWRLALGSPLDRAALRWYLSAMLIGVIAFLATISVPVLLRGSPLIPQGYAWTFLVLIYVGEFVGVFRYRLFQLEPWFAHVWLWLVFGLIIVVVDAVLIVNLGYAPQPTLILTLLMLGWLYFPARQWVMGRLAPGWSHEQASSALPWVMEQALDMQQSESLEERMRDTLQEWFQPLSSQLLDARCPVPYVEQDGLSLCTPTLSENRMLRLNYAQGGNRLFVDRDAKTAASVLKLFRAADRFRQGFQQGVSQERRRLARDLHDDISGHLLQIVHRSEQQVTEQLGRQALNEIRNLVTALESEKRALRFAVANWRLEFLGKIAAAKGQVDWNVGNIGDESGLAPRQFLNLRSVLREVANNALKHLRKPQVEINWTCPADRLQLRIHCSGHPPRRVPQKQGTPGLGMRNIRSRVQELGGKVEIAQFAADGLIQWTLNLEVPLSGGVE